MKKNSNKTWSDVIEVISYIMWSISVWILSHFQQHNYVDYTSDKYRVVTCMFMLSGFLFYKDSYREVTKEIVKSFIIVFTTTIYQSISENTFDIDGLVEILVMQVLLQSTAYVFVWIIKQSKKLHGDKTLFLQTIFMISIIVLLFIFRTNIGIALLISIALDLCLGYRFYRQKLRDEYIIEQQFKEEDERRKNKERENELNKMKAERYDKLIANENKIEKKKKIRQNKHNKRSKNKI